ncbi:dopamine beta-hydroxylase-like isoform X4 [Artemia franciscana]
MDDNGKFELKWTPLFNEEKVVFLLKAQLSKKSWIGIGFSDYGNLTGSDLCFYWEDWRGRGHMQDTRVLENGTLVVDDQQDCEGFQYSRHNNSLLLTFTRKWITCDPKDYKIEDGTVHVTYVTGPGPLFSLDGINVKDENHGFQRTRLLQVNGDEQEDSQYFDVLSNNAVIPPKETTYWCRVQKIPEVFKDKHHVIQFEANIQAENEGVVHHIEVFYCEVAETANLPLYSGPCDGTERPQTTQACKRVIAAWAMGAGPFSYPKEAGQTFGGSSFSRYIMLEVHYNNPRLKKGIVDNSGIRLYYTKKLRKHDAGIIELGLEYTDKMAIPPLQEEFVLSGYCVPECTAVGLPQNGITVFGSQLHTHLTGKRVMTRHIRNGRELPPLNQDLHYSPHFQEIRLLREPVNVLPGDSLITSCWYDTTHRKNVTLGGFSISDEMCVNYIHYYPKADLEVCKSSVSDQKLNDYFEFINSWEDQPTDTSRAISENYRAISWTPLRAKLLDDFYTHSAISMQCNKSDGNRFPGVWEGMNNVWPKLQVLDEDTNCEG